MNMNPNSFDGFYYTGDGLGSALAVLLVIYLVVLLLTLAFSVVCYVLSSLGVYTVAKRRGILHPWLSWIPVGNMWILGSISDQYQYLVKGKIKNRRKILIGVMIALLAMALPLGIAVGLATVGYTTAIGSVIVLYLVYFAIAIFGSVIQYMAYYDLFRSCRPDDATLFLVLGILFQIALPFFLFSCRKKDLGMPPRKADQSQTPAAIEPPAEESVEEPAEEPLEETQEEAE